MLGQESRAWLEEVGYWQCVFVGCILSQLLSLMGHSTSCPPQGTAPQHALPSRMLTVLKLRVKTHTSSVSSFQPRVCSRHTVSWVCTQTLSSGPTMHPWQATRDTRMLSHKLSKLPQSSANLSLSPFSASALGTTLLKQAQHQLSGGRVVLTKQWPCIPRPLHRPPLWPHSRGES